MNCAYFLRKLKLRQQHCPLSHRMADVPNYVYFYKIYVVTQIVGLVAVMLVFSWMCFYSGGFGYQDRPDLEFRWHPLMMTFGMLYANGQAIMVYRGFRQTKKYSAKVSHMLIHLFSMIFTGIGFKTVWDSHVLNKNPQGELDPLPNFYSLHSWIGISTITLFVAQFLGGFFVYFWPLASLGYRKSMPIHRGVGLLIFILSLGSALLGISERAAWKMTCWTKNKEMCSELLITNLFGVLLVAYACGVITLVSYAPWARLPLPIDEGYVRPTTDDGSDVEPCINNRRIDDDN